MPTIRTARLLLRDLAPADWPAVEALLTDPAVTRRMHFARWDDAARRRWFAWCLLNDRQATRDAYNWAIVLAATGELVGWLGIGGASRPSLPGERSCGYALRRASWGQGYATEALRAVLRYEFETLGASRVAASCAVANPASARVLEKAGMRYLGSGYDADCEGNWAARRSYALDQAEYLASAAAGPADPNPSAGGTAA